MCGICGKIDFTGKAVDGGLIRSMAAALAHRGPDDEGVYLDRNAGLGHRRLSIIDLSPAGHQPMTNEDGTIWIVLNGEIYNFPELRDELLRKGHVFRSHSDTEAVIHLYEEEGVECVRRLRGMFAFAIWDARSESLFLARDRVGKKPLFYRHDGKAFHFGSEIKAILRDPSVRRAPDHAAIHHYLTYQDVPSPWTAFQDIKKLPPAHSLTVKNGRIEIRRYWKLSYLPKIASGEEDLKREVVERLREAVRIRLMSDVPLGAFLSGGVDSSATVALMAGVMQKPVKTFSIGFKEEAYNELRYARMVAERYGTDHAEFIVEPDAVEILPKLVWHYNEPFADSSAVPTYYVSKLAREHVTVILNGDGGDENFAGYGRYTAVLFASTMRRFFPASVVRAALPLITKLPHRGDPNGFIWRLIRFCQEYARTPEMRNASFLSHFSPEMKKTLYTDDFRRLTGGRDSFDLVAGHYREAEADTVLDRLLYADVMMYLPDDLLVKVDIASMANSLEARSPFLDHEFMEFAARIPSSLKLNGRTTKHILKEALRGMLPPEVLFREKMGFGVPIDHWFRNDLREMAYDTLLGQTAAGRGYFRTDAVKNILDEHVSGAWNWQYHIWNLLMLELWHRQFIDEAPRHE